MRPSILLNVSQIRETAKRPYPTDEWYPQRFATGAESELSQYF